MTLGDQKMQPTIAIDFDGPLHAYSKGWGDGTIYDGPAPGAKHAVAVLMAAGFDVVVYTARKPIEDVEDFLAQCGFPLLTVHNEKPPALAYIDDRGIHWVNWQQALGDLRAFLAREEKHTADAWDLSKLDEGRL